MIGAWRFLDTGAASGSFNMALDEAILTAHADGLVPPTIRVYAWQQPTVSLGYAQRADSRIRGREDVARLLERCRAAGLEVVRRPTGGRAILHHLEVTYSAAIRTSLLEEGSSIVGSYRFLCGGLVNALRSLGIAADFGDAHDDAGGAVRSTEQMCFALGSRSDLLVKGAKVVGSAQARRHGALLQHGSIPLRYDRALQGAVFGSGFRDSEERGTITSLEREAGRAFSYQEVAAALKEGFESLFGCPPEETGTIEAELALSRLLASEKYSVLT